MTDMMRSAMLGEAMSWVQSQWLALPSWKKQRAKGLATKVKCLLLNFLCVRVIKSSLIKQRCLPMNVLKFFKIPKVDTPK